MEKACDQCKRSLKDEYGICDDCRALLIIKTHQDHIMFCSEYIAGKWGIIDDVEFEVAQAEITRVTNEINHLSNGSIQQQQLQQQPH